MPLFGKQRITRTGPGRFVVDLPEAEADLLRALGPQLRTLLGTDDPSLRRLFPVAYAHDPELDAGYQALARDELMEKHLDALGVLDEVLDTGEVGVEALNGFMKACNDLRLVLGTRLDVSESMDPPDEDDPDIGAYAVYEYLGLLVALTVEALADDL